MPRKEFEAFTRLDASDVNTFLMDQSVMSFAGTAARGSAIATPVEGMVTFLEDSDILSIYDGSAWKTSLGSVGGVLQVVSTTKTDPLFASISAANVATITGLSATITPRSSANRILVMVNVHATNSVAATGESFGLILKRGATAIGLGDAASSRTQVSAGAHAAFDAHSYNNASFTFLDSPATTSATTYSLEIFNGTSVTRQMIVNAVTNTNNLAWNSRQASTITLMEVAN
jgi:hypothetical protein